MAEGWAPGVANAILTTQLGTYTWIQLHIGAPGAAGTSNPAVNTTRKQVTWSSPSGGAATSTADITWASVPASEDYTHWSAWSANTAGTFGFSGTITANPAANPDDFTLKAGDVDTSIPVAS